jgi:hypothetical protein
MQGSGILESLAQLPWSVVARTYGNTQATLTGLLVNWWVGLSPVGNWALEGGISARKGSGAKGGRKGPTSAALCDLLLCMRSEPVGAVKVEGSKPLAAVAKLDSILATDLQELRSLRFALLAVHSYEASGRGENRALPPAASPDMLEAVREVSGKFPGKPIVVIAVERNYQRWKNGVRALNEHYWGTVENVQGILFEKGEECMRRPYDVTVLVPEPTWPPAK